MKNYKKLYHQATEEVYYWKERCDELRRCDELQKKKQEDEPYCVEVYLENGGKCEFEKAVNHKIENYPCVYYLITMEGGLSSVFKYDEVKYILAYRKGKDEQRHKNNMEEH